MTEWRERPGGAVGRIQPHRWRRISASVLLKTHVAALGGGAVAAWVGTPLPFMIGALVTVAVLGLSGVPTATHRRCRDGGILVLMTGIGLGFTPTAAATAIEQLGLILAAGVITVAIGCAIVPLLAHLAGIDRRTAFFCAVPGGAAEMSIMGERHGAAAAPIAMSQLMRIVTLVLVLPPALTMAGVQGDGVPGGSLDVPFHLGGLIVTLILALLLSTFLRQLGLSSGFLLGPMAIGVGFALSGNAMSSVPTEVMQGAQVLMGAYLGAQFQPEVMRSMRRFMPAAALSVVLLAGACFALGAGLHWLNGERMPTMLLATAPGSVTEMSITADVLGLNTPLVTAYHLLRIFIVLVLTPPAFAVMQAFGMAGPHDAVAEPAE